MTADNLGTVAFVGGRIMTMDPARPDAETVVIEGGRIAAIGGRDLLEAYPAATRVELGDRTLTPGFIDAHNHMSYAAFEPVWADLHDALTKEAILDRLRRHTEAQPEFGWVHGFKYRDDLYEGPVLTRHDLDELGFDRPIFLMHVSFHMAVVNSRALELLGIGRTTPDPPSGEIEHGPDGEPTGRLFENAWGDALRASIAAHGDPERWADLMEARMRFLLRNGVTALHDTGVFPESEAVYRKLRAEQRLPISVLMMPSGRILLDNRLGDRLDGPTTGEGDEWLRVGPVKLFGDGATPATVGVEATQGGAPFKMGEPRGDFADQVLAAVDHGFDVTIHAIGNTTLDVCLDAFEESLRRSDGDRRFRVEHFYLASARQRARAKAIGLIAGVQPLHIAHLDLLHTFPLDDLVWLPFRQLDEDGIRLAAGSDDPCTVEDTADSTSPILGAVRGETRRALSGTPVFPDQSLPFERWLQASTADAAYAGRQEDERGRLAPGLRADLVVLDGPPSAEHPPAVEETWVAGKRVYRRDEG